jgi:hypothetical protein
LRAIDIVAKDPSTATKALTVMTLATEATGATGANTRDKDPISVPDIFHAGTYLFNCPDRFMAKDASISDLRNIAFPDVQVTATDRGDVDSNDRVRV